MVPGNRDWCELRWRLPCFGRDELILLVLTEAQVASSILTTYGHSASLMLLIQPGLFMPVIESEFRAGKIGGQLTSSDIQQL